MSELERQDHINKVRNTRSTDISEENIRYWIRRFRKLSAPELDLMTIHGNTALAQAAIVIIRDRKAGTTV